jgi:multimeric flavodoxin WrbA
MLKAVAFNGSPRKGGNTELLLRTVLAELEKAGIQTELVPVGGTPLRGCIACMKCREPGPPRCAITTDDMNRHLEKALAADIILIGSPTYFADVTAETKALIDRIGFVARGNGSLLAGKLGAAVIAVRRAGAIHAFDTINHFFLINGMVVVGSSYWNLGVGREKGEVANDAEGMGNMVDLGQRLAAVAGKLR